MREDSEEGWTLEAGAAEEWERLREEEPRRAAGVEAGGWSGEEVFVLRNTALEHIERHKLDGIVYFADDDNIYSLELFDSLQEIRRFGTWPGAMLAQSKNKAILEGPICNGSQVIGWHTNEKSKRLRRFHVDMSGFAFNNTILWDPKRWYRPMSDSIQQLDSVNEGFQVRIVFVSIF
ncbi:hypothetical protein GIB67_022464 [Kingdonia uniflora]|uniref:Glycosyltransferases n=1 Tax=Kingdonia uniflora TaxID=39325 RepID=A0A7J7MU73_9MAGN|nr:hypothetical protein GIB67_022464 [Kingdonia uniflora]